MTGHSAIIYFSQEVRTPCTCRGCPLLALTKGSLEIKVTNGLEGQKVLWGGGGGKNCSAPFCGCCQNYSVAWANNARNLQFTGFFDWA